VLAGQVLEQREAGTRLTAQAVLFRAASHSAALELELQAHGLGSRRQRPDGATGHGVGQLQHQRPPA